jgi:hypothetical protein
MRIVRPSLLLVVVAASLLAGCSLGLRPTATLPASFGDELRTQGWTFTASSAAAPAAAAVVADLGRIGRSGGAAYLATRAVPVAGVLTCAKTDGCAPGPAGRAGERARSVWLILYPEWVGPGGDIAWVIVDAIDGLDQGFQDHDPLMQ